MYMTTCRYRDRCVFFDMYDELKAQVRERYLMLLERPREHIREAIAMR
jgi:hypothetical protein